MSLEHLYKKIEQVQNHFPSIEERELSSVQYAIKREGALRVAIQSLTTWLAQIKKQAGESHPLYKQAILERNRLKEQIYMVSGVILASFNGQYQTAFTLDQVIADKDWYYYQFGIMKTLHQSGIMDGLFQKLLTEIIPSHPKDEYPLARKMERSFIIHAGPTNSGKTHESLHALKNAQKGIYLSPLRLLALEVYERLNEDGVPCDLLTGEEAQFSVGAKHVSCTIEKASYEEFYEVAVIDEGQMIGDAQRGYAWTRAVLGIRASEIHICCAPEAVRLMKQLIADCKDRVKVIRHERQTPLVVQERSFLFPNDVRRGDALIVFSRKRALQVAGEINQQNLSASVIYGNLPPETRRKQVELFLNQETDVVVSTDAIGMGMNLPIRRVVFLETEKFDGSSMRELTSQEVKQIAGRAGRKGIYEEGMVNTVRDKKKIRTKLETAENFLNKAFFAPHESTIMGLPFGTLRERLQAWTRSDIKVPYFKKADISEILELLDLAQSYEAIFPLHTLYTAVTIPFDYMERDLLSQWFVYLDCMKINRVNLPKPKRRGNHLAALETYYRAIGLYYSFASNFNLPYDWKWIRKERQLTSEQIHERLRNQNQPVTLA